MGHHGADEIASKIASILTGDSRYLTYLILSALGLLAVRYAAAERYPQTFQRVLRLSSAVLICFLFACATSYLFVDAFFDRIESDILITASNWTRGLPIHPDWRGPGGAYGLVYGPFLNELLGWPLFFSRSVRILKVIPYVCFCISLSILLYLTLAKGRDARSKTIGLCYILMLAWFSLMTFWVRGEAILVALSAAACLATDRLPKTPAAAAGALAGLSAATKVHAIFYFVPVLGVIVLSAPIRMRSLIEIASIFSVVFLVFLLIPYGFSVDNLRGHWLYLSVAARHGISGRLLAHNLSAGLCILIPYAAVVFGRPPHLRDRNDVMTIVLLSGCVLMVALVAAKPGAGPYHLLPFIPFALFAATRVAASTKPDLNRSIVLLCASIAIAIAPLAATGSRLWTFGKAAGQTLAAEQEASSLARRYPGAEFGPANDVFSQRLAARIAAAANGGVQKFGTAAWLDLDAGGVKPRDAWIFQDCHVRDWIIPNEGRPFSAIGAYASRPLFPDAFQAEFVQTHALVMRGEAYSVWRCSR